MRDYADPNPNAPNRPSRSTNFLNGDTGFVGGTVLALPGVPATLSQEMLLDPITGNAQNRYDVTQLDINFTLAPNRNAVSFDVVFGSEEFPEYVNLGFNDGFGLFVNGQNIAYADNGAGALLPISIDHPLMRSSMVTELDGVLAPGNRPIMSFAHITGLGSTGTLTFILADVGDGVYDTTAFIRALSGATIPEPAGWSVGAVAFGSCLIGLLISRGRRALGRKAG